MSTRILFYYHFNVKRNRFRGFVRRWLRGKETVKWRVEEQRINNSYCDLMSVDTFIEHRMDIVCRLVGREGMGRDGMVLNRIYNNVDFGFISTRASNNRRQ